MNVYGKTVTLHRAARRAQEHADMLTKLYNNSRNFEAAMPTTWNHLQLVYVGTGTTRNEVAADIARLQCVIEKPLDENDTATEVKAGRITVTIKVVFPFEQEQRKAA